MWWLLPMLAVGADRSAPPPVVPATPLDLDEVHWQDLDGVRLGVVTLPDARKVAVTATLNRGALDLDGTPTEAAWLTGWLADAATDALDPDELELARDALDLHLWTSGGFLTRFFTSMEVPLEDLEPGLALYEQVLRNPRYPRSELRDYKERQRYALTVEGLTDRAALCDAAVRFGWYGPDSGYAARNDLRALQRVKRRDLRDRHARLLRMAPITVLVVGDLSPERAAALIGPVFDGLGQPGDPTPLPDFAAREGTRVLAVHVPGDQAQVRLRRAAPSFDHPDHLAFDAVGWALGGPFNSRLNTELREQRGLTYGASAWYSANQTHGYWTVEVEVAGTDVGEAVQVIQRQVRDLVRVGATDRELLGLHHQRVGTWNTTRETAPTAMSFYQDLVTRQGTVADLRAETAALARLTTEHTRRVAEAWLAEDRPELWVLVGDRATLEPQLDDLGWEVRWLAPAEVLLGTWSPW